MKRLLGDDEVTAAMTSPPTDTRAFFRGESLRRYPAQVAAASWDSVVFDLGRENLVRIPTMEPLRGTREHVGALFEATSTAQELVDTMNRDAATAILGKILKSGDVVLWENDLPDTYAEEPVGARLASPTPPTASPALSSTSPASPSTSPMGAPSPQPAARREYRLRRHPPPGAGEGESLPVGMQSVMVDGVRIAYREDGPPDAPPVIVLHGWGANSQTVSSIQMVLRETHRTIAPDLPGFGVSDPPPVPWGAEEYAESVRGLMRALGIERASLIGHSHGGRTSIVLAATHPELVDRLVLVDSAGLRPKRHAGYYARVYAYKAGRRLLAMPPFNGPLGSPIRRAFQSQVRLGRFSGHRPAGGRHARHTGTGGQRRLATSPSPHSGVHAAHLGRA